MNKVKKFDIDLLTGKLSKIKNWMKEHHFPPKLLFFLLGIISSVWFLFRVIPKPTRAGYPCMKVAAPFMSALVLYLLSLGGIGLGLKKAKSFLAQHKYVYAVTFLFVAVMSFVFVSTYNSQILNAGGSQSIQSTEQKGPEDKANQPFGTPAGVFPGRVVWIWNPEATNENIESTVVKKDWYWKPESVNDKVIGQMFRESIMKLTGSANVKDSWNSMFQFHNKRNKSSEKGYVKGEKIFIKINQGTSRWLLTQAEKDQGFYYPASLEPDGSQRSTSFGSTETHPYVVLEILRELVNEVGIDQADIAVGDPMTDTWGHNYDVWVKEFPNVKYTDKFTDKFGRTKINPTEEKYIFYSDKTSSDGLYDILLETDYMINLANLKPHLSAGISLTAKNHFGSQGSPTAGHLHYALISPRGAKPVNGGYGKYRVLVDLMGSKYLGRNTVLYFVDGLFGGGSSETRGPVKYFMSPFDNDWSNSMFVSLDEVAIQSVCYDFLRTEWDGVHKHGASNNSHEWNPNWYGVDDFLHQAADPSKWPAGIVYDPDNSGKPLPSLGVHEHWNNPEDKQYSRNLGLNNGIELVSIPETLVKSNAAGSASAAPAQQSGDVADAAFGADVTAKSFHALTVDDKNVKWFLTETGIVSYDGKAWNTHNKNRKVSSEGLKDLAFEVSSYGRELWIATPQGATVATLPVDARSGATTYYLQNSQIVSENVVSLAIGKDPLRWFGTEKGVSGFYNRKWLKVNYTRQYPAGMFQDFPIKAMAASSDGDSLFVATEGAGVARFYRDKTDAISGASEYAQWGSINIPSDNVYSICLTGDTQWFGTDAGIGKHDGYNTLTNWTVYNTKDGLVNDFVQAIAAGKNGVMWFGTKGGASLYDGSKWTSYTEQNGLNSNNVLCIKVDNNGTAWLGTDKGVTSISDGKITRYK